MQPILAVMQNTNTTMDAEKIICCDRDNDNALAAAIMANGRRNDDPYAMAALMNQNQQWNNPFSYLIWMMFAGRFMGGWNEGFGGQNAQNVEMQNQLQAIRTQLQDNQNTDCVKGAVMGVDANVRELSQMLNVDFNALKDCCCDIRTGIARFSDQMGYRAEQVIAAMERGNSGILSAVQNCCCETQKELIRMQGNINLQICQQTGELRNGQRDLGVAITQGFSQVGYQQGQDKCEILRAIEVGNQGIKDLLNTHWKDEQAREIQDLKAKVSQQEQTDILTQRFFQAKRYGYDGCGCGYNNGCASGCGC